MEWSSIMRCICHMTSIKYFFSHSYLFIKTSYLIQLDEILNSSLKRLFWGLILLSENQEYKFNSENMLHPSIMLYVWRPIGSSSWKFYITFFCMSLRYYNIYILPLYLVLKSRPGVIQHIGLVFYFEISMYVFLV